MNEYLEDKSEGKFYSRTRIVGHILAVGCIAKLSYLIKTAGLQSLSLEYKIMSIFLIFGWFIIIPATLFMQNLSIENYESRAKLDKIGRAVGYYIWTPIHTFGLLVLLFIK